jgi:hypothetical protein
MELGAAAAGKGALLAGAAAALLWPLAGGEALAAGKTGMTALLLRGWPAALAAAGIVALVWMASEAVRVVAAMTQRVTRQVGAVGTASAVEREKRGVRA